jgi:hypothetical protein
MGHGIVDTVFWILLWPDRFGWGPGLHLPEAQVLEDLFDDILILYHTDDFHLGGAFRASQMVYLPGSSPGQAPIF